MASKRLLFAAVLALSCAVVWTEILLYSQNTPQRNGGWIVAKRELQFPPTDADSTALTRVAFAGNRLRLGVFGGHQLFLTKTEFAPSLIDFRFRLDERAYLDVVFGETEGKFSAVRLSARADSPSMRYRTDTDGRFTETEALDLELADGWHRARLRAESSGFELLVDDRPAIRLASTLERGRVGFRGGQVAAEVSEVRIESRDGSLFEETFRNSHRQSFVFTVVLAVFAIGLMAVARVAGLERAWNVARACLIAGLLWFSFDTFYWSRLPEVARLRPSNATLTPSLVFERLRSGIFGRLSAVVGGAEDAGVVADLRAKGESARRLGFHFVADEKCWMHYGDEHRRTLVETPKSAPRFLLFGGSQQVGLGADSIEKTFFCRLHGEIRERTKGPLVSASKSIGSSTWGLETQMKTFESQWSAFEPDVVALTSLELGTPLAPALRSLVVEFVRRNRERGIRTVFFTSPLDPEMKAARSVDLEELAREIRAIGGVVLDLDDDFERVDVRASGLLWWDLWHLTTFGQALAAERLADEMQASGVLSRLAPVAR